MKRGPIYTFYCFVFLKSFILFSSVESLQFLRIQLMLIAFYLGNFCEGTKVSLQYRSIDAVIVLYNLIFVLFLGCLDGTQSKVRIGNCLSSSFPIENGLIRGDALSPLLFNFALEYAIRKVKETNLGLNMNGIQLVLAYVELSI